MNPHAPILLSLPFCVPSLGDGFFFFLLLLLLRHLARVQGGGKGPGKDPTQCWLRCACAQLLEGPALHVAQVRPTDDEDAADDDDDDNNAATSGAGVNILHCRFFDRRRRQSFWIVSLVPPLWF